MAGELSPEPAAAEVLEPACGSAAPIPSEPSAGPAPGASTSSLSPSLDALARALAAEPAARVSLERCRAVFNGLPGGPPGDPSDPRRALADALAALGAAKRLRLPSLRSRQGWDRERQPPLPRVVVVPRVPRPPRHPLSEALHPLLARARDLAVGVRLPADVDRLDAWLKGPGRAAVDLPLAERSYEIFGEEKRLDAFLRTRFALQGRLDPASFGAHRVLEPFAMTAFDPRATWAVALENLASYDSLCRVVEALAPDDARPAAVIFGRGTQFVTSCAGLPARLPAVQRVLYVGDLDPTGLEIGLSAQATLAALGVALAAWEPVYEAMLARPLQPVKKAPAARAASASVRFLPRPLQARALEVLLAPARVPQESVARPALERILVSGRS